MQLAGSLEKRICLAGLLQGCSSESISSLFVLLLEGYIVFSSKTFFSIVVIAKSVFFENIKKGPLFLARPKYLKYILVAPLIWFP